jgi:hypothetical protein
MRGWSSSDQEDVFVYTVRYSIPRISFLVECCAPFAWKMAKARGSASCNFNVAAPVMQYIDVSTEQVIYLPRQVGESLRILQG